MSGYRRGGDLRRGAARPANLRRGNRIFYAVAEGQGTEYDYLSYLNLRYGSEHGFMIKPHKQQRGLSASQVVEAACRATQELSDDDVAIWALFDHDGRPDIDQAVARARRHGVRPGLSHPSFELWLLLHFQEFTPAAQNGSSGVIINKLRGAHPVFAGYGEGDKRIDDERFSALADNNGIMRAAGRARRLSSTFSSQVPSGRDPSTDLYLLIEELGIADAGKAE